VKAFELHSDLLENPDRAGVSLRNHRDDASQAELFRGMPQRGFGGFERVASGKVSRWSRPHIPIAVPSDFSDACQSPKPYFAYIAIGPSRR
jgi:hypothetical protein